MSDIKLERIHPIRIMLGKILDVLKEWIEGEYRQEDVVVELQQMGKEFEGFDEITWYSDVFLPISLTDLCSFSEDRSVIADFPVNFRFGWLKDGYLIIEIYPAKGNNKSSVFKIDTLERSIKANAFGLKIAYVTIKRVLDELVGEDKKNNEESEE